MQLGFLKDNEPRVSITPSSLEKFISLGHKVSIEKNAGILSGFSDSEYNNAKFYSRKELIKNSNVILSVNSSSLGTLNDYKGKVLISNFSVDSNREELKKEIKKNKIIAYDLSMIPRTTIAQSMDILSSMAGLSGYKAIIKAAELLPKIFPYPIPVATFI